MSTLTAPDDQSVSIKVSSENNAILVISEILVLFLVELFLKGSYFG